MTTITRAVPDTGFRGGIDVRVSLRDGAGDGGSAFDGAWFPRGRDLAVTLRNFLLMERRLRALHVLHFCHQGLVILSDAA